MQKRIRTITEDEVVDTLIRKQDDGYDKYNQGIDFMSDYDWLAEAEEEMADGLQYIVAARMRRDLLDYEVQRLLNDISNANLDCGCYTFVSDRLKEIQKLIR